MIQIKKNDYVQPTEVREEVVQGICEAFLGGNCWTTYHPFNDGPCRKATRYIRRYSFESEFFGFASKRDNHRQIYIEFNGAEMKRAFEELIKAGYYMFQVQPYGWMGYRCGMKPYMNNAIKVESFNDFID